MRLSRVYTDQPLRIGGTVPLSGATAAHLTRVLRLGRGAPLVLFNGQGGEYAATLESEGRERAVCAVHAFDPVEREAIRPITVVQGIARGDRMDTIVQKCTELGASRVIPLAGARSVVRTAGESAERKRSHWLAVAISACEQCGRNRIPRIDAPLPIDAALAGARANEVRVLLEPDASLPLAERAAALRPAESLALLVGPEGGLSDAERALALGDGFVSCGLGPRVLRTETAALAAISVVQAIAGDFRRL